MGSFLSKSILSKIVEEAVIMKNQINLKLKKLMIKYFKIKISKLKQIFLINRYRRVTNQLQKKTNLKIISQNMIIINRFPQGARNRINLKILRVKLQKKEIAQDKQMQKIIIMKILIILTNCLLQTSKRLMIQINQRTKYKIILQSNRKLKLEEILKFKNFKIKSKQICF